MWEYSELETTVCAQILLYMNSWVKVSSSTEITTVYCRWVRYYGNRLWHKSIICHISSICRLIMHWWSLNTPSAMALWPLPVIALNQNVRRLVSMVFVLHSVFSLKCPFLPGRDSSSSWPPETLSSTSATSWTRRGHRVSSLQYLYLTDNRILILCLFSSGSFETSTEDLIHHSD